MGSYYNAIGLWKIPGASTTPDVRLTFQIVSRVRALKFGADGTLAAGLADGRVLAWLPEFSSLAAPAWETAAGREIGALTFSLDGKTVWSGDERGDLKARDARIGALQSTLRLMAPLSAGAAPRWIRWNRAGTLSSSAP